LDRFDALISKIIFKKFLKNIILMYFGTKNILKSYRNNSPKHAYLGVIIYKNDKTPIYNGRNSLDSWGFFT
jgi:hypothetical protein